MDDNRFDDIIRKKAESFEDTGHDAHALTDFRRRLSSMPKKNSSWTSSKTAYIIGLAALFTLINFGISWYFSEGRHAAMKHEIDALQADRSQLIALQDDLTTIRTLQVDTVYIHRNLITPGNTPPRGLPIQTDQANINNGTGTSAFVTPEPGRDSHYTLLSASPQLSQELESFLISHNLLLTSDNGEMMLLVNKAPTAPTINYYANGTNSVQGPKMPQYLPEVATMEQPQVYQKPDKKRMSNQMVWALEKHNHGGVDFQFGVEGKYHKSNFDVGNGERNGGLGFMSEVIFSPALRLETGIHFTARAYKISEDEINSLPPSFFEDYPGYDDQLGAISSLESDADMFQIPLNLKYFAPLDHNKRWYVSAGLTPQWARKQEFDYKYSLQTPEPPDGGEFVSFVGSKQEVGTAYYTTTINLGVGTEVYLNERLRWQLGVFYQKGLGDAGYENRKLENSFGVKSSLWFNRP